MFSFRAIRSPCQSETAPLSLPYAANIVVRCDKKRLATCAKIQDWLARVVLSGHSDSSLRPLFSCTISYLGHILEVWIGVKYSWIGVKYSVNFDPWMFFTPFVSFVCSYTSPHLFACMQVNALSSNYTRLCRRLWDLDRGFCLREMGIPLTYSTPRCAKSLQYRIQWICLQGDGNGIFKQAEFAKSRPSCPFKVEFDWKMKIALSTSAAFGCSFGKAMRKNTCNW